MKNPFQISDYMTESDRQLNIKYVETQGSKLIEDCVRNEVNTIIVGKRGIGKSTAIKVAYNNLTDQGIRIGYIAGSRTMADIYRVLWGGIIGQSGKHKGICYNEAIKFSGTGGSKFDFSLWFGKPRCRYWACKRKERCRFDTRGKTELSVEDIYNNMDVMIIDCPLKRYILHAILYRDYTSRMKLRELNITYILDIPDTFSSYNIYALNELIPGLQFVGKVILIMNEKQYTICERSEVLGRLSAMKFPLPTESELMEIAKGRMTKEHSIPDTTLSNIISTSELSPRKLFQACEYHLFNYDKYEKVKSEDQQIDEVIRLIKKEGNTWVKVKDIKNRIRDKFNTEISDRRIGRKIVENYQFEHRHNPDSEYKVN